MEPLAAGYGLIEGLAWDAARGLLFSDVIGGGLFPFSPKPFFSRGAGAVMPLPLRTPLPEKDSETEPFHSLVVVNQAFAVPVEMVELPENAGS